MDTPVALLIFNRPECTRRTFAAIREAQPRQLLIVADGPRTDRPGEAQRCEETRGIIAQGVDWPCEVATQYSVHNLGCRARVSSGLDWVFSRAEEAIILEDDCLPHATFFPYCEMLLHRYREDARVMMIAGAGMDRLPSSDSSSYRFSKLCHIWGWASWRRAWQHYDVEMPLWPEFRDAHRMHDVFSDPGMIEHWTTAFERVHQHRIDTWDYQLNFASFAQNGVNIVPRVNLVTNIGHTADATHTHNPNDFNADRPSQALAFPLRHPPVVLADNQADQRVVFPDPPRPLWKRFAKQVLRRLPFQPS